MAENLLRIDRENDRPRKDIAHFSEVKNLFSVTPIELNDGDELFVMSDGVSGFVDRMPDCFFAKKSIQTILNEQEEIYRESGKPLDDRTVISVKIS